MQANIKYRIQRWRPNFKTPKGEIIAPRPIPIPAIANAIPKPAKPASGSLGSLKLFRESSSAIRVSAVIPPR